VIFDCVQFPRTGRVHRSEVAPGSWLTLPLARQPREVLIRDLEFAPGARAEFDRRLAVLPWLAQARSESAARLRDHLHSPLAGVVDFLEAGLNLVNAMLGIDTPILRRNWLTASRPRSPTGATCPRRCASSATRSPASGATRHSASASNTSSCRTWRCCANDR